MKCICAFFLICGVALTVKGQSDGAGAAPDVDTRGSWDLSGTGAKNTPRRPGSTATPSRTTPTAAVNPGIDGNGQLIGCPCRSTQETNLVCGTDGNTYGNLNKLNCAKRCGHIVEVSHSGGCRARDIVGLRGN